MPKIGVSELAPALAWPKYFYQGFNRQYFRKVLSYRPIAYWPLWEASGSVAYDISGNGNHGAYTGVTLGQIGIGDGRTCPLFDGANDYVDIYSDELRDAFNKDEGTMMIWAKVVNAAYWDVEDWKYIYSLAKDGSDMYLFNKQNTVETLRWIYGRETIAYRQVTKGSLTTLDFFHMAMTWSKTDGETLFYYNGVQEGAADLMLGTWAEVLTDGFVTIGAKNTTPNNAFNGWCAHSVVFDSALNSTKIADLSVV